MMKCFWVVVTAIFSCSIVLVSCGDELPMNTDPDEQLRKDIDIIDNYFIESGFSQEEIDTTENRVRYVIINQGIGENIDENDIVHFDYTGKLVNDTIYDTSIASVADSIRNVEDISETFQDAFRETKTYAPLVITYSKTGWTISGRFVSGFADGINETFCKMRTGGKVIIAMPSALGYRDQARGSIIPANSVLIFELFPVRVVKQ